MSQRQAVTKVKARAYARGDRASKPKLLDELVELTGWHRDYARTALRDALIGTPFPISSSKSIYANPEGDNIQQNYARIGSAAIDKGFNDATSTLDAAKAIQIANDTDKLIWQEVHSLTTYSLAP